MIQPGEESLDLPAVPVAPQRPAVLGLGLSRRVVRRDHLDAIARELGAECVAVVRPVPDEVLRKCRQESSFERAPDELRFMALKLAGSGAILPPLEPTGADV